MTGIATSLPRARARGDRCRRSDRVRQRQYARGNRADTTVPTRTRAADRTTKLPKLMVQEWLPTVTQEHSAGWTYGPQKS